MLNRSIRTDQRSIGRNFPIAGPRFSVVAMAALLAVLASGCTPEIGSDAWCTKLRETPKADWSANQALDFAKHCLLK